MTSIVTPDGSPATPETPTSWVKVITTFGVPATIAMYLVWQLAVGQTTALAKVSETLADQKVAIAEVALVTKATAEDAKASSARIESYLRVLCVNLAKTTADRNTCLSVR